jgi:3D (Asp-Asp-Asp) domain-containing protein
MILGTSLALIAQEPGTRQTTKHISIRVDGSDRKLTTTGETIQAVLQQEQITLGKHDQCTPPVSAPVTDGQTIVVARVTCTVTKERVPSPVPTITRWDRRMTVKPVVLREGKAGVVERTRVVWKKDGVVSVQWTQNPRVVAKPVARVVVRGNIPSRGPGNRRVLTMHSTAYDPGPASCGRYATGYTAIGMRATRGVVAVDPRVIPLGSRVYVEGYGAAIAGDTGGAIKGNRIDVCFPSRAEALRWGRRTVKVVVLE